MTRVSVVGHVEWVDFLNVPHLPARGTVLAARRASRHAGGGGVVAAVALVEHGAEVDFFCAVGDDPTGDRAVTELRGRGIRVHAARRPSPTREVLTLLEEGGERTIVTVGERLAPSGDDELDWELLERADGVYLTAGDTGAARRARAAGVLVATPRIRESLDDSGLRLDALVFSGADPDEVAWAHRLESHARIAVATDGERGGRWWGESEGRWSAVEPLGPVRDSYGCGDAFAAGITLGLSRGMTVADAAALGASCGASMLVRVGAP